MEEQKVVRNMVSVVGVNEKHKYKKLPFTDSEYAAIISACEKNGYNKPRDLIVDLCVHDSPLDAISEQEQMKIRIKLLPLSTYVNKINSGIDEEESYKRLLEGVENLCHTYRL